MESKNLFIVSLVLFFIVGCTTPTRQDLEQTRQAVVVKEFVPEPSITEIKQEPVVPIETKPVVRYYSQGEPISAGSFQWKIKNFTTRSYIGTYFDEDTLFGERADGVFLIIDVEVENIGNLPEYLESGYIVLIDDKQRVFQADTGAAVYLKPEGSALEMTFSKLNPGIIKKGKIVYDIPKELKAVAVTVFSNKDKETVHTVNLKLD